MNYVVKCWLRLMAACLRDLLALLVVLVCLATILLITWRTHG